MYILIIKGSDENVICLGLVGFWTLPIIQQFRKDMMFHNDAIPSSDGKVGSLSCGSIMNS
jgi:hypothetical protein